jgi:hypothetical protein
MNLTFNSMNGTKKQEQQLYRVERKLHKIINSVAFREKILSAKMTETKGLSNKEIYELIMSGKQLSSSDDDTIMDLDVFFYYKWWSRVVGYTYQTSKSVWTNVKYTYVDIMLGSNLVHEYTHQLGFKHLLVWKTSVPYTVGRIIEELW